MERSSPLREKCWKWKWWLCTCLGVSVCFCVHIQTLWQCVGTRVPHTPAAMVVLWFISNDDNGEQRHLDDRNQIHKPKRWYQRRVFTYITPFCHKISFYPFNSLPSSFYHTNHLVSYILTESLKKWSLLNPDISDSFCLFYIMLLSPTKWNIIHAYTYMQPEIRVLWWLGELININWLEFGEKQIPCILSSLTSQCQLRCSIGCPQF